MKRAAHLSSPFCWPKYDTFASHLETVKVHTDFQQFAQVKNAVVTIGTFDGVHPGHRKIIDRVNEIARELGGESILLTFYPHPRMVLHPDDHDLQLLNTPQEKIELLREAGLDHVMIYPFSLDFARWSAFDYVRDLLVNGLRAHTVVVGYDHRFGRNREGDHATLLELSEVFGFKVEEIPPQTIDMMNISSTKIRQALLLGHVSDASRYLGRPYSLSGIVVHGDKIGRTLGFPTANVDTNYPYKLIPPNGIYAVRVKLDQAWYNGVMNIGIRPTTHEASKLTIEVFIFDFEGDIYGKQISVDFVERIRDERKFGTMDELKEWIASDVIKAKAILN